MLIVEIVKNPFDWNIILGTTKREIKELLNSNINFTGGHCFHLALALFLKSKKLGRSVEIILDGGHAAIYDIDLDKSIDCRGIHNEESALNEKTDRVFKTARGLLRAVKSGFSTVLQNKEMIIVFNHFK